MRLNARFAWTFAALALCFCLAGSLTAQDGGGGGGNGGGGNGGGGGGGGGDQDTGVFPPIAGVEVDATGVLRVKRVDPRAAAARIAAARQNLPADLQRPSELRKVSLNRLEAALAESGRPTEVMAAMAGLTGIDYVFFYPESGDVVVAGPAEAFAEDAAGRIRGIQSGRPVVLLEDMVTALRAFPPAAAPTKVISVSIDPTAEGLARLQQVLRSLGGQLPGGDVRQLAMHLKNNLGMQTVTIQGVPTSTHFAHVLVEADYRMKLIGIGLERLPMRFQSYVERAHPAHVAANAMERWYFVPNYEGVTVSPDGLAMQLSQHGVKLVGANERVIGGERRETGRGNRASQAFCSDFTEQYDRIAAAVPVYAQLRNVIDASIAAAYIQQQDFYGQAGWEMPLLGDEARLPVETHNAPQQVETAVNAIWKGNRLMTPLGGGINVQPRMALASERLSVDASGATAQTRQVQTPQGLQPGQWWWD